MASGRRVENKMSKFLACWITALNGYNIHNPVGRVFVTRNCSLHLSPFRTVCLYVPITFSVVLSAAHTYYISYVYRASLVRLTTSHGQFVVAAAAAHVIQNMSQHLEFRALCMHGCGTRHTSTRALYFFSRPISSSPFSVDWQMPPAIFQLDVAISYEQHREPLRGTKIPLTK